MKKSILIYFSRKGKLFSCNISKISFVFLFILTCFITSCSDLNKFQEPETREKEKATITIVSGNNQSGQGGKQLADAIVVKVKDSQGIRLENVTVLFRIVEGGGSIVNEATRQTDYQGLTQVFWVIGSGYNGIEVTLTDANYQAAPRYLYAKGENPTGIFKTRTISSLKKIADTLYAITFYGDYSEILKNKNSQYGGNYDYSPGSTTSTSETKNYCSLFSAFGDPDNYLFGRSFDNPSGWRCLTLVGRYNPPDGYASLAPVRMRDFGFHPGIDFDKIPFIQKEKLLEAAFFTPDGINEHGVVVGLANVRDLTFTPDPNKKSIFVTLWVREILDHARNVDEAVEITRSFNVFYRNLTNLGVHALVADPSGRSAILELYDDEMRVIPNTEPWQVITNSPTYNVPISQRRDDCWRYRTVYDFLEAAGGKITWQEGMDLLQSVGNTYTEWTAMYDMTQGKMILAIDYNFDNFFHFTFE